MTTMLTLKKRFMGLRLRGFPTQTLALSLTIPTIGTATTRPMALERVPESLLEAAADLGARRWQTNPDIVLPLALPGIAAGSIFTFSLTLGDYITPILVGGAGSSFIGNVAYSNVGIANNLPFAAAVATVPIAIMAIYLLGAKRLGAFEAL